MRLEFWGTRGSLPMNTPQHRLFGGNTSCVALRSGEDMAVFDAGSGLVHLGTKILATARRDIDIFFSHFHSDHICGLPFFKPLFDPSFSVRLHSFGSNEASLKQALNAYLSNPIFPIGLADFKAQIDFVEHEADDVVACGDLHMRAQAIPHPGGAHALKASTSANAHFVYATDTEHEPHAPNQDLIGFMHGVDLAVYDCTYDDDEFATRRGWGHSTWQEGVRLAQAAQVKQFGIFHHEPERTDDMLLEIEAQAQKIMPNCFVTRDFMHIEV